MASACASRVVTGAADESIRGASPLVDADWLRVQLGRPGTVVLDATVAKSSDDRYVSGYDVFVGSGHIPGARHADLVSEFSDPSAPFPFTRPSTILFQAAARAHGIGRESTVVVYDSRGGAWAARLWWLLRAYGHEDVRVLDGGLRAWVESGGELHTGGPGPAPAGDFCAEAREGYFVDTVEVRSALNGGAPAHLVCALTHETFVGGEPVAGRRGHIPGSLNVPYPNLLDHMGRIDVRAVREVTAESGLPAERTRIDRVIGYCGGGINAAGLALALSVVGFTEVAVYDGSLAEWNADPCNPLRTGET